MQRLAPRRKVRDLSGPPRNRPAAGGRGGNQRGRHDEDKKRKKNPGSPVLRRPGNSSVAYLVMQNGNLEYGQPRCGFKTKHQSTKGRGGSAWRARRSQGKQYTCRTVDYGPVTKSACQEAIDFRVVQTWARPPQNSGGPKPLLSTEWVQGLLESKDTHRPRTLR